MGGGGGLEPNKEDLEGGGGGELGGLGVKRHDAYSPRTSCTVLTGVMLMKQKKI